MVHCFTLIHDDLPCMDNDDFRRGRPSNHKVFGEGMALLAGDALMASALDTLLIAAKDIRPEYLIAAVRKFSWACGTRGVMGGQALESTLTANSNLKELEAMFAGKTGALFSASLLVPMAMAGVTEDSSEGKVISEFAAELGYAFQVADDIEDAEAPGSKEAEKPQSILYYLGAATAARQTFDRLTKATLRLKSMHGDAAGTLASIAEEVSKKLEIQGNRRG
jgi:geranylgeranyl diphosphate synthase type II